MTSYTEPDVAHVVLVNAEHQPVWRMHGPADDLGIQALTEYIESDGRRVQADRSVPADAPASQ